MPTEQQTFTPADDAVLRKPCTKCGIKKLHNEFSKDKTKEDGLRSQCKPCVSEYRRTDSAKAVAVKSNRKYYQSNKGKDALAKNGKIYRQTEYGQSVRALSSKRQKESHPERFKARYAVNNAVRVGRLVKDKCSRCGSVEDLEFHHHKGYEEENYLDVKCLCRGCHRKADVALAANQLEGGQDGCVR